MRRRDFITGLTSAAVSPLAAHAQRLALPPVDFTNGNGAFACTVAPFKTVRRSPRDLAAALVAANKKRREARQREEQKQDAA
jgi:hypothetical protein